MNPKLKKALTTTWNDPRFFFFGWFLLLCLPPLVMAIFKIGSPSQPTDDIQRAAFILAEAPNQTTGGVQRAAFILAACSAVGSGLAFIGFVLSWIPPIRRAFEQMVRYRFYLLACVITVIALFYAVEDWRGKHAWKQYVRAQEARGERMDLAAFISPPIPDDQNLALCPLFKPIFNYRYPSEQEIMAGWGTPHSHIWPDTNGMARLCRLDLTWDLDNYLRSLPEKNRPRMAERAQMNELQKRIQKNALTNGWIDLTLWRDYYRMGTNLNQADPANTPAQDVIHALRQFEPDLMELREEANRRPLARWPVHYDLDQPWGILLPHLTDIHRITKLLQVRAAALLVANRVADGVADIELGWRVADSLDYEPFLICQWARNKFYDELLQPLKEGLARHQFSDAQLDALEQQLRSADLLAGYQLGRRCERSINGLWTTMTRYDMAVLIQVLSGSQKYVRYFRLTPKGWIHELSGSEEFVYFLGLAPKGWIYQNQLGVSRLYDDHLLSGIDIKARTVNPKKAEAIRTAKGEAKGPYSALVPFIMIDEQDFRGELYSLGIFAHGQTQVDLARVACALERHRLARGEYPETIEGLAPRFMAQLPHDIVGGQPLKYRRTDDGRYLLYSIGWNAKDDGGSVALTKGGAGVTRQENDWVWRAAGESDGKDGGDKKTSTGASGGSAVVF